MDKKNFLNIFEEEDKSLIAMIFEDIELCKKIQYPVYSEIFITPQVWNKLNTMSQTLGIDLYTKGLNDTSEKRACMFVPRTQEVYSYDFPITFFTITGGNKFKELEHRHFLAAIMSLGIKREKLGDLIVRDRICYGVVSEDLFIHIKTRLTSIGKLDVFVSKSDSTTVPTSKFEDSIHLVSSLRLDNVVASITGNSRNSAVDLINEGLVTVNYNTKRKKDLSLIVDDIISIRRFGKFSFSEILGESKKGKTRILLKKYI